MYKIIPQKCALILLSNYLVTSLHMFLSSNIFNSVLPFSELEVLNKHFFLYASEQTCVAKEFTFIFKIF